MVHWLVVETLVAIVFSHVIQRSPELLVGEHLLGNSELTKSGRQLQPERVTKHLRQSGVSSVSVVGDH